MWLTCKQIKHSFIRVFTIVNKLKNRLWPHNAAAAVAERAAKQRGCSARRCSLIQRKQIENTHQTILRPLHPLGRGSHTVRAASRTGGSRGARRTRGRPQPAHIRNHRGNSATRRVAVYGNFPRVTGFVGFTYAISDLYHPRAARRSEKN